MLSNLKLESLFLLVLHFCFSKILWIFNLNSFSFQKFVLNSCRERDSSAVDQAWDLFEKCIKSDTKTDNHNNTSVNNNTDSIENNSKTSVNSNTEDMGIKEEKKKRKSKELVVEEQPMDVDTPKKKKKKDKSFVEEPEDSPPVEKKKKRKSKDKSFAEDADEVIEKPKKKKRQEAAEEDQEEEDLSPKKKHKQNGLNGFNDSHTQNGKLQPRHRCFFTNVFLYI